MTLNPDHKLPSKAKKVPPKYSNNDDLGAKKRMCIKQIASSGEGAPSTCTKMIIDDNLMRAISCKVILKRLSINFSAPDKDKLDKSCNTLVPSHKTLHPGNKVPSKSKNVCKKYSNNDDLGTKIDISAKRMFCSDKVVSDTCTKTIIDETFMRALSCKVILQRLSRDFSAYDMDKLDKPEDRKNENKIRIPFSRPKCEICNKKFKTKSYFKRHIANLHLENTTEHRSSINQAYQCAICDIKTCDRDQILEHFVSVHPRGACKRKPNKENVGPATLRRPVTSNNNHNECVIDSILDKRTVQKTNEYLVKWKGYSEEESTWELADKLNCFDLIRDFQNNFRVEKIIDMRESALNRGVSWSKIEYLVKWRGFEEKYNTWEPLEVLSCHKLIKDFKKNSKQPTGQRKKPQDESRQQSSGSRRSNKELNELGEMSETNFTEKNSDRDSNHTEEDIVQKIVNTRVVAQKHEYLIKWKGLDSDHNTWKMTEDLNCWDLIRAYQRFWTVEKILDKRVREIKKNVSRCSFVEYLVKWKGYEDYLATWEPLDLLSCIEQIQKFEKTHTRGGSTKLVEKNEVTDEANSISDEKNLRSKRKRKGNETYNVEKIKAKRITDDGDIEYLIKWRSFEDSFCEHEYQPVMGTTWEPLVNLNCSQMIKQFESEHPARWNDVSKVNSTSPKYKMRRKQQIIHTGSGSSINSSSDEGNNKDEIQTYFEDEYAVEAILDRRAISINNVEYLVKWKNYEEKDSTWEPAENLYCFNLIKRFLLNYSIDKIVKTRMSKWKDAAAYRSGIEYLVRWEGYGDKYNTWEPIEVLSCSDMILEFETRNRRIGRVCQKRHNSTNSKHRPISSKKVNDTPSTTKNSTRRLDQQGQLLDKIEVPDRGANNCIGMKVIHFAKKKSALSS